MPCSVQYFADSVYDTLSVNVEFVGQNWPNIKWVLKGFSGIFYVFFLAFLWHKNGYFYKKNLRKLIL